MGGKTADEVVDAEAEAGNFREEVSEFELFGLNRPEFR